MITELYIFIFIHHKVEGKNVRIHTLKLNYGIAIEAEQTSTPQKFSRVDQHVEMSANLSCLF